MFDRLKEFLSYWFLHRKKKDNSQVLKTYVSTISREEHPLFFNPETMLGEDPVTKMYRDQDNQAAQRRFEEERSKNQDSDRR